MKIKCPWCDKPIDGNFDEFREHCIVGHFDMAEDGHIEYIRLLFKIHEKIESWNISMDDILSDRFTDSERGMIHRCQYQFESLLENEK